MIHAFRLGYIELGTETLEAEQRYFEQTIGATVSESTPIARYISLGVDHHNIALVQHERSTMLAIGLWVTGGSAAGIAAHLEGFGIAHQVQHDTRPGVPELVEVDAPAGVKLHLFPRMEQPAPGFRQHGVCPVGLGHVALATPEAPALTSFLTDALGFRTTDWFEGLATFLTCNHEHHVINMIHAPVARTQVHHIAFALRDSAHHYQAADRLASLGVPIVWGPSRHTAGHNYASYHFDPSGNLVELYSDMDIFIPELNCFEPRPWHDHLPQQPKVWPLAELSTWSKTFGFDLASVLAI